MRQVYHSAVCQRKSPGIPIVSEVLFVVFGIFRKHHLVITPLSRKLSQILFSVF